MTPLRGRRAAGSAAALAATLAPALATALCGGCSAEPRGADRAAVAERLLRRTGFDLRVGAGVDEGDPGDAPARPADGLSERGAVDLALDRNAAFQERLAELGLTRADVIQAGLVPNPELLYLFPLGAKGAEATLSLPLEFLWLRGARVGTARAAADAAVERLVQAGMDLVRDVRLAYADLALARRRLALTREASELHRRVAELAAARVRAGDALPLDEVSARVDALRAAGEAGRLEYDAAIAEERLRALLGIGATRDPVVLTEPESEAGQDAATVHPPLPDADALVDRAVADRPDALSAVRAVVAAERRARAARAEWFVASGVLDYNQRGSDGAEAGPGIRLGLPLFNQNQGAVARAVAELERARRQRQTIRDRIILEVREAHHRAAQARQDLADWRTRVRPALEQAVTLSESAYRGGEAPLVQVLDASRLLLDGRVREAQAAADLRRALADLERAVGRRLDVPAPAATRPTQSPAEAPATAPAPPPVELMR